MIWSPWRTLVRRAALRHGFLDPFALLARLQRFAQPSEVAEPIELLRAGMAMHARGLVNSRVIQNNLDWVWPYWVRCQFDPADPAFVPRAFSLTYINLTHRSWTAVGLPDAGELPVVDPRGLVTPFLDGWSLDGWILTDNGVRLLPAAAAAAEVRQDIEYDPGLAVVTTTRHGALELSVRTEVVTSAAAPVCRVTYTATAPAGAWLVIALRPFNPEGVSSIEHIELAAGRRAWQIDDRAQAVHFSAPVERHQVSHYRAGDVCSVWPGVEDGTRTECEAGMATTAACFAIAGAQPRVLEVDVPLPVAQGGRDWLARSWGTALDGHARFETCASDIQRLYDIALRTLVLLSPDEVFPGPNTYRRFWYRDAAFMIQALLCAGLTARARRALDHFPERQSVTGYFHSQDGEWDANGEALWILARYCALTGHAAPPAWRRPVLSGARWIARKRTARGSGRAHAGLLPPGFSAEHFGPNDYYYWDDFWSVAGLRAAAAFANGWGEATAAAEFVAEADDLLQAIETSLGTTAPFRAGRAAMPASPYRRLDAGAVGNLVAGYPLSLWPAEDERLRQTAAFLFDECLVDGGFFHEIVHSGINAYLTLHLAQVLLRAEDPRAADLMRNVARLASPTGQWPEAIHPRTGGGCMGDGQHGWAAAEWVMMVRNCLLCEHGERLVLGRGVQPAWLDAEHPLRFGPAPTDFGSVEIEMQCIGAELEVRWHGAWRTPPAAIDIRVPGHVPASRPPEAARVRLARRG